MTGLLIHETSFLSVFHHKQGNQKSAVVSVDTEQEESKHDSLLLEGNNTNMEMHSSLQL